MDGTKNYLKHYGYKLELSFFAKNGTRQERWQAEKELVICERKPTYWEKHPKFVGEDARRGMEALNRALERGERPLDTRREMHLG